MERIEAAIGKELEDPKLKTHQAVARLWPRTFPLHPDYFVFPIRHSRPKIKSARLDRILQLDFDIWRVNAKVYMTATMMGDTAQDETDQGMG